MTMHGLENFKFILIYYSVLQVHVSALNCTFLILCVCDIYIKNRWALYRDFRKTECYSAGPLTSRTGHTSVKDIVFFTNFKKKLNPFQTNIHWRCLET